MTIDLGLRGERVNSRVNPMRLSIHKSACDLNRRIGEAIPYWPEVISSTELAQKMGLSVTATVSRVAGVQEEFMVFQHKKGFSRIKPDYSNIEERMKR